MHIYRCIQKAEFGLRLCECLTILVGGKDDVVAKELPCSLLQQTRDRLIDCRLIKPTGRMALRFSLWNMHTYVRGSIVINSDQLHHAPSLLARLSTAIFFYEEARTCWRSFHTGYWLRRDRVTGQGMWHVMMREAYLHTVSTTFWRRLSRSMRHK